MHLERRRIRLVGWIAFERSRAGSHLDAEKSFSPAGGIVEVERTKHLYQADEFFGLGIKGVAGAWRLAELIDVGRTQRLHDQPALVLIDFDVVAHLILLNAAGPRPTAAN